MAETVTLFFFLLDMTYDRRDDNGKQSPPPDSGLLTEGMTDATKFRLKHYCLYTIRYYGNAYNFSQTRPVGG